jgi:tyrosine-protein kinase Etk/Wzc
MPNNILTPQTTTPRPAQGSDEPEGPTLFDVLLLTASKQRAVLGMALAGGVIAAGISLLIAPLYKATAVIMPPQQQQSSATALLGQLGAIGGLAERDLGIRSPADLYIGVLGSRTISDDLIEEFDLKDLYRQPTLTKTREILANRSKFTSGKGLITISVEDHDPKRAAALTNAYIDELHKQTNRLALTESAQRRLFFQQQLEAENKALANSEIALRATQERTGVLQVSAQVDAVIRSLAQLRAEIASREVALSSLRRAATASNPEVVRQETELAALREQLSKIETRAGGEQPGDPFLAVSEVPKAGIQYLRAARDLKYHETLFELTAKQYEAAKLDEAREAPLVQVIDEAVPPEVKSWPYRTLFAVCGFVIAGIIGFLYSRLRRGFSGASAPVELSQLQNAITLSN